MRILSCCFLLIALAFQKSSAQGIDSLQWADRKLDAAYDYFAQEKWRESEQIALKVLSFADRRNEPILVSRSCALLAELNRYQNRYLDAIEFSVIGIENAKGKSQELYISNSLSQIRCLDELEIWDRNIDLCDELKNEFDESLEISERTYIYFYLARALKGLEKLELSHQEISALLKRGDFKNIDSRILIGEIYEIEVDFFLSKGEISNAKNKLFELIIQLDGTGNNEYLSHLYQRAAAISLLEKNFSQAIAFYNKAENLFVNDGHRKAYCSINKAQVYFISKNYESAILELEKALLWGDKNNNLFVQAICNALLSRINGQRGFISMALTEANEALRFAQVMKDNPMQLEIHELIRDLHEINNSQEQVTEQETAIADLKAKIHAEEEKRRIQKAELVLRIKNKELSTIAKIQSERNERLILNQQLTQVKEEQRFIELRLSKELAIQNEKSEREKATNELRLLQTAHQSDLQRLRITQLEKDKVNESLRINELNIAQLEKEKKIDRLRQNNENLKKADQIKQLEIDRQIAQQRYGIIFFVILIVIVLILMYFSRNLKRKNKIIAQNSTDIHRINSELKDKNFEIVSGIEYASKFQEIVFPSASLLNQFGLEGFIVHRALDIVSGDLPYVLKSNGYTYIAAVDCIGHGVSASMLSIMTYFNLNDIIKSQDGKNCGDILQELHKRLINRKEQDNFKSIIVSVDVALIRIPLYEREVQFAGANLPLIIKTREKTEIIKGSLMSIGEYYGKKEVAFQNHNLKLEEGTELYVFSDGFYHQFGGEGLKQKLSKKRTLDFVSTLNMDEFNKRHFQVSQFFDGWKSVAPQTDDVVFIGVKLSQLDAPQLFSFNGHISESKNAELINDIKQLISSHIHEKKSANLMLMTSIELLDNALRYSTIQNVKIEIFDIGEKLRLKVSNHCASDDFKRLNEAVSQYVTLNTERIEELYLNKLSGNPFNKRGGAGLGLLQLIRKGLVFESIQSSTIPNSIHINCELVVTFKK